jgi:hypothetical protein
MPNTLAHLGINGITTRALIKKSDFILIYVGAVIPDIPWIIQRAALALIPGINVYDLRLYCIVLSSLFLSIFLSAALAYIFPETKRVFIIFSLGAFIHLLLDSIEIKWANGVHLLAPFNWDLFTAGFFWPESITIYVITLFGFLYVLYNIKETVSLSLKISFTSPRKIFTSITIGVFYFSLPLLLLNNAETADNHFVKTLRDLEHRPGSYFEVDRGYYVDSPNGDQFITPFKEKLIVTNLNLGTSGSTSIRAKFISRNTIQIIDYHIHSNRDIYSYVGLIILVILVTLSLINNFRRHKQLK